MANQMIALQARAPQSDFLGAAVQRNAQMINMMSQQAAAQRQAEAAQQQMQLAQAKEARESALAAPTLDKAKYDATLASIKTAAEFNNFSDVALGNAANPEQAMVLAKRLAQQPQFQDPIYQGAIRDTMATMPTDPAKFLEWKQQQHYKTLEAKEKLKQHFNEVTNGAQAWTQAMPEYAGTPGAQAVEVAGSRVDAPQGITYVKGPNGEVIPVPSKMAGGDMGLVGGERGGAPGFDTVYGNGQYARPPKPITGMSIGEVQNFQRGSLIPATRGKVGAGPDKGTGAVGAYQITYGTLQKYAPKVLGPNWQSTPFTSDVQDRLARAIYEDNRNGDLSKVWAGLPSNKPGAYSNVPWEQARGKIAAVESGGAGGGIQMGQPISGTEGGSIKTKQKERETRKVAATIGSKIDSISGNIDALLNDPGLNEITGNWRGSVPGGLMALTSQSAANALAKYKTIAANATISELQELRAASPTGGALGQVSDYEDKMLRDAAATLDRAQDLQTFKAALVAYKTKLAQAKARLLGAYAEDFGHEYGQYSEEPSGAGSIPPSAIQHLRQNPSLRSAFDAKYGAGAAAKALGGR